jgi:hypothetical protein
LEFSMRTIRREAARFCPLASKVSSPWGSSMWSEEDMLVVARAARKAAESMEADLSRAFASTHTA